MPSSTDPVPDLPFRFRVWDSNNLTNGLVAGDDGETVAESRILDSLIRVAHTAGQDLGEDLDILVSKSSTGLDECRGLKEGTRWYR